MPTSSKHTKTLKFTLLYVALSTLFYFIPAEIIPLSRHFLFDTIANLIIYFFFTWLLLASLGSCPLRWRSLAPWVFVIALSHIYWIEFLQGLLPELQRQSSYYHLVAGMIGAIVGIFVRLKYAYNHCNCNLMHQGLKSHVSSSKKVIHLASAAPKDQLIENGSSFHPIPLTIADHPGLNAIIATALDWKPLTLHPIPDTSIEMVCTGKSLVSLPHFSYGNIRTLAGKLNTQDDYQQMLASYALPHNIAQIEIRQAWHDPALKSQKTASWLTLSDTMESQMKKFSPNLRRKINKSIRNGFVIKQGNVELLKEFWKIYAKHIDSLGSVALPEKYYEYLMKSYTNGFTTIFLVYDKDKPVGAAFNLAYKGFYENDCFATLQHVQGRYASYFLHYHMIHHAIQTGCHTYSFGRSTTGNGVHTFKKQWGTTDIPLLWSQYPAQKINLRKQGWLQQIWKLLPWSIRSKAGDYLAKWIY